MNKCGLDHGFASNGVKLVREDTYAMQSNLHRGHNGLKDLANFGRHLCGYPILDTGGAQISALLRLNLLATTFRAIYFKSR